MTRTNTAPRRLQHAAMLMAAAYGIACAPPPERVTEQLEIPSQEDHFVVWRGFDHAWSHNHRWNRLGNWAEPTTCQDGSDCWGFAHAAASGTSTDTANFTTAYTEVTLPGAGFHQMTDSALIEGDLGVLHPEQHTATLTIPLQDLDLDLAERLRDRASYAAWLNGWDIVSEGERAAKPMDFALEVFTPVYDAAQDAITVEWTATLGMGCSTLECRAKDKTFLYSVQPRVAVLGFGEEAAVYGPRTTEHDYAWDAPGNPFGKGRNAQAREMAPNVQHGSFTVTDTTAEHVPLITRVSMNLFHWVDTPHRDMHMLEWHSVVSHLGREGDQVHFDVDLMFKNWAPGMSRFQRFSYADVGAAHMQSEVDLLEVPGGQRVVDGRWNGSHKWRAMDRKANTDDAVTRSIMSDASPLL